MKKKYNIVIETSPDQAGTYEIIVEAINKKEAIQQAEKWIRENRPHLTQYAQYYVIKK